MATRTPKRTPAGTPRGTPRKPDRRGQVTVKGKELTPEFRALWRRGAEAAGMSQAAFMVAAVTAEAQRRLTGDPLEVEGAQLPAVVADRLEASEMALAQQSAALAQIMAELGRMRSERSAGLWSRLRAVLWGQAEPDRLPAENPTTPKPPPA